MNLEQALTAYINIRDAFNIEDRKYKEYKKEIDDKLKKIETYIHNKLNQEGIDNITIKGVGTTFKTIKDSVAISDGNSFKRFLAERMLLNLQSHMYKNQSGNFRDDGRDVLNEHVDAILNSGAFDLLSVKAHKLNCKTFMADNDGLMPKGVDYTKETVVQVRKK